MKYSGPFIALGTAIVLASCASQQSSLAAADAVASADADTASSAGESEPISRSSPHGKDRFVKSYDADGDGRVTYEEFRVERKSGYDLRDANSDGEVHEEEYVSEYDVRLKKELDERYRGQIDQAHIRFNVLDSDDDGNLTLAEFNASGERIFRTLDTNGDGVVDESDAETHF